MLSSRPPLGDVTYDVIIVGVGAMGAAAACHLARRGQRVLALERFDIPNAMGSSHGVNRIIRRTYYEHPSYVPLLARTYELWRALEQGYGEKLLHITGGVDAGPPGSVTFEGSLAACREFGLPYEVLGATALSERFPAYRLPADSLALFQPDAGFVEAERSILAHVAAARSAGAEIRTREPALEWSAGPAGVAVRTAEGSYAAGQLVLSAGAWLEALVPTLRGKAVAERQVLGWFQPNNNALFKPDRFPVFNVTVPEGDFYGFPIHGVPGFKFGRHHHLGEIVTAEDHDREPNTEDETVLRYFAERYFPAGNGPLLALKTCLYTNAPDEHFIIGRLPEADPVLILSPCSGHGFKFAPVIGEIVADLILQRRTAFDIGLFDIGRPVLA